MCTNFEIYNKYNSKVLDDINHALTQISVDVAAVDKIINKLGKHINKCLSALSGSYSEKKLIIRRYFSNLSYLIKHSPSYSK